MQEDFLHYIWKFQKLNTIGLLSNSGDEITVLNPGLHNDLSGPDFFNAQVRIGGQLWAGNVEIHVNSTDWYLHGHETDSAYNNVILHVVWNHDCEIFSADNQAIPTLSLRKYVQTDVISKYEAIIKSQPQFINCEKNFASVPEFTLYRWIDRLFIERLERKSKEIQVLLEESKNDWEAVLFKSLAKTFGLKINGDAFFSLAKSFDYSIIRKINGSQQNLEALFYGQLRMLGKTSFGYEQLLIDEYRYLKKKFKLENSHTIPVQFFKLRPPNFPTIRLSQLAALYSNSHSLFANLIEIDDLDDFYRLMTVSTSEYWQDHYTFGKTSKPSRKILTKSFIDLVIINTIIPLKFTYLKSLGKPADEQLIHWAEQIAAERNTIVENYHKLRKMANNSLVSQSLLELNSNYCNRNRCLNCEVGVSLLKA